MSVMSCKQQTCGFEVIAYPKVEQSEIDTLDYKLVDINFDTSLTRKIIPINDSIAINFKYQKAGNFIDVVNMHSGETLCSYFSVGEGPQEMLYCDLHSDGTMLIAIDYIRNRFTQFHPDSLLNQQFRPKLVNYPYNIGLTSYPIQRGDSILMINPFRYINRTYNVNQDVPRFFKSRINEEILQNVKFPRYYTQNVGQQKMIRNHSSGDIWSISIEKSKIEVYDLNLDLIRTIEIISDVSDDAEIVIDKTPNGEVIAYKGQYPLSFTDVTVSPENDIIFLCLVGKFIGSNDKEENHPTYIILLDWDGNLIKTYILPTFVRSISSTEAGLFATVDDEEGNPNLIRLNYEKL